MWLGAESGSPRNIHTSNKKWQQRKIATRPSQFIAKRTNELIGQIILERGRKGNNCNGSISRAELEEKWRERRFHKIHVQGLSCTVFQRIVGLSRSEYAEEQACIGSKYGRNCGNRRENFSSRWLSFSSLVMEVAISCACYWIFINNHIQVMVIVRMENSKQPITKRKRLNVKENDIDVTSWPRLQQSAMTNRMADVNGSTRRWERGKLSIQQRLWARKVGGASIQLLSWNELSCFRWNIFNVIKRLQAIIAAERRVKSVWIRIVVPTDLNGKLKLTNGSSRKNSIFKNSANKIFTSTTKTDLNLNVSLTEGDSEHIVTFFTHHPYRGYL